MTESRMSFLGVPVTGTIAKRDHDQIDQRPIEELRPLLEAVLADPLIEEIGWTQYTPYFNDGDACEFSAGEPWCRTVRDGEDEDRWSLTMYSHKTFSAFKNDPEMVASKRTAKAFCDAIEGGQFEDVLLQAFGDHALVTVRKDGVGIQFYQHD